MIIVWILGAVMVLMFFVLVWETRQIEKRNIYLKGMVDILDRLIRELEGPDNEKLVDPEEMVRLLKKDENLGSDGLKKGDD